MQRLEDVGSSIRPTRSSPSENSFVDTQVTDIGDDILSGTQSFEVETPSGTTDDLIRNWKWTALTDIGT